VQLNQDCTSQLTGNSLLLTVLPLAVIFQAVASFFAVSLQTQARSIAALDTEVKCWTQSSDDKSCEKQRQQLRPGPGNSLKVLAKKSGSSESAVAPSG
jgi:hypothetical protein